MAVVWCRGKREFMGGPGFRRYFFYGCLGLFCIVYWISWVNWFGVVGL